MYGNIVPIPLQDELIFIRDAGTRQSWRIADITEETIRFNRQNGTALEMQLVYSAVGMFVGRASRTIREYHAIGRFFDPEIRELFPVLAFDHFRHAATLGDRNMAILALQWAADQVETLNRPATVDAMIAKFLPPDPGEPEPPPDMAEGAGGIYTQIYRSVTSQVNAASRWMEQDIDPEIRRLVKDYWKAALAVAQGIPIEEVE